MFEAHSLYADDFLPQSTTASVDCALPAGNDSESGPADIHLLHAHHLCPLYIWFARGKRKNAAGEAQATWYIHVEYRRANGSHGYRLLEVQDQNGLPANVWQRLTALELPDICPEQTRLNPVKR